MVWISRRFSLSFLEDFSHVFSQTAAITKNTNAGKSLFYRIYAFYDPATNCQAFVRTPLLIDSKCHQIRHGNGNNVTPMLPLRYSYITAMLLCNGFQKAKAGDTLLSPLLLQKPVYKILLPFAGHNRGFCYPYTAVRIVHGALFYLK